MTDTPTAVHLSDYTPSAFLIEHTDLRFELGPEHTTVCSQLQMRRNPDAPAAADLRLDGDGLETVSVALDGQPVGRDRSSVGDRVLTIRGVPDTFVLQTRVRIRPLGNTALEGLYCSNGIFCTQCEAQGFRRITWYLDRPDVMAPFSTTIVAEPDGFPVLLSNGNPVERGSLDDGRHWVRWEDPYPKPAYLFALVAGDLACIEDSFTTRSGREVGLRIYVEPHNREKCGHAMTSLKKAMRWDESEYGLEYDLDIFMIVAVDDFNMGAMENKGLNIFNSRYVLARPETATDSDFEAIESVIAHEYFHNWTGNRVTCRDWFQLSLKEGLTVFRDQQFSAAMGAGAVKRIQDVRTLRTHQFAEDSGPMAHPVRPESYIEINNFYTVTVYNKGAEVIRMMHTLLGRDGFRNGMDLYFERHDGQAVTTDDFVSAMEDACGVDLGRFRRWYDQAGTPRVSVGAAYHRQHQRLELTLRQSCPATPGQPEKKPFHIPIRLGLLGASGEDLPLQGGRGTAGQATGDVLSLETPEETFVFEGVAEEPVLSIARGFSAPVRVEFERSDEELAFLLGHDADPFNRWDAGQTYATRLMLHLADAFGSGRRLEVPDAFLQAFERTLNDPSLDGAFIAEALTLPSETQLADAMEVIDVEAIHAARETLGRAIGSRLAQSLSDVYRRCRGNQGYVFEAAAAARRALANRCLAYLMQTGAREAGQWCMEQFEGADNMTDVLAALRCFASVDCEERKPVLEAFHQRWREDSLVMDKWFAIQATSPLPGTLAEVRELMAHPAFDIRRPNKVRALIGSFCLGNPFRFHAADGSGYRFLVERVLEVDALNPQIAARLMGAFTRWRRFEPGRRELMRHALEKILAAPKLSNDVYEIATRTLDA